MASGGAIEQHAPDKDDVLEVLELVRGELVAL